jgi:TIM-barrel protein
MFEPRVAVASLSGESDAEWALAAEPFVGCAFLGGLALDAPTRAAARALVDRERTEFIPDSPIRFLDRQLSSLADADLKPACNVRSVDPSATAEAAAVCADHGAIIEVNAHCRQAEMCDAGAGETLLRDAERLSEQVAAASDAGATVSVKVRAEVPGVDLPRLSRVLVESGADVLHVDAMDSEPVVAEVVSSAPEAFVIANNGVRDRRSAHEYLEYGADAVSVGRPSDDPTVLKSVREAVEGWFDDRVSEPIDPGVTPDA